MIGSVFLMHHAVNAGDGSEIAGRVQRTRLSRRRRTKRHAAFDAEGFSSVAAQEPVPWTKAACQNVAALAVHPAASGSTSRRRR